MKLFMILSALLILSCNSDKNARPGSENAKEKGSNQKGQGKQWTNEDQVTFMDDCITEARKNMKEDSAQIYCGCMLTKAQAAYPKYDDISEKMTMNQVNLWAADCLGKK